MDATPSIFAELFQIATGFEQDNPDVRITLETSQKDQMEAIQLMLCRGVIDDLPAVFLQGFDHLRLLADRGFIVPVGDLFAVDATQYGDGRIPLGPPNRYQ